MSRNCRRLRLATCCRAGLQLVIDNTTATAMPGHARQRRGIDRQIERFLTLASVLHEGRVLERRHRSGVKETMAFISHLLCARRAASTAALKKSWLTFGLFPALIACGIGDEEQSGLPGEIGSDRFVYECATVDDPHCRDEVRAFPEKIAVGARFDLKASTSRGSFLLVEVASPHMVAPARGEFIFSRAGLAAFLALQDQQVHDFVHLLGVEVASLEVQNTFGDAVDRLALSRGQKTSLTVVPFDDEGDTPAGSLTYRWATDNEAAILIERTGTSVTIDAQAPGEARVKVSLGDELSLTLDVVVHEGAETPIEGGLGPELDAQAPGPQGPSDGGSATRDAATTSGDAATAVSPEAGETEIDVDASTGANDGGDGGDASDAATSSDAGGQP